MPKAMHANAALFGLCEAIEHYGARIRAIEAGDDDRADRPLVEEQRAIALRQLASTFATTRCEARAKCRTAAAALDWEIERRMMAPSAEERLVISALRDAAAL